MRRTKQQCIEDEDKSFKPTITDEIWSIAKQQLKDMIVEAIRMRRIESRNKDTLSLMDNYGRKRSFNTDKI